MVFYLTKTELINLFSVPISKPQLTHEQPQKKQSDVHTTTIQSYSSKVTKLVATIRSRELTTMAPLAVLTVGVLPRTSGRWQQATGGLFGLQLSGAR